MAPPLMTMPAIMKIRIEMWVGVQVRARLSTMVCIQGLELISTNKTETYFFLQSSQQNFFALVKSKLKYIIISVLPFKPRHKFFFSMFFFFEENQIFFISHTCLNLVLLFFPDFIVKAVKNLISRKKNRSKNNN